MNNGNHAAEVNSLRGRLLMRNMTLDDWARANGYKPHTVRGVVRRHWGKPRRYTGILTREILLKLEEVCADQKTEVINS